MWNSRAKRQKPKSRPAGVLSSWPLHPAYHWSEKRRKGQSPSPLLRASWAEPTLTLPGRGGEYEDSGAGQWGGLEQRFLSWASGLNEILQTKPKRSWCALDWPQASLGMGHAFPCRTLAPSWLLAVLTHITFQRPTHLPKSVRTPCSPLSIPSLPSQSQFLL
jgi:hypothetical protein